MSVVAAAIVTSAVVGGVVSNNASERATEASVEANQNSQEFDEQRYRDWLEVYGPIQSNLADYYGNLTPEYYESLGLQAFNQEFETGMQRLNENLAQSGISEESGIAASLKAQAELDAAESRAEIRSNAPRQAAEEKTNFLQIGLGQNPANNLSNNLANQASQANQNANNANIAAGQAIGDAVTTIGSTAIDVYNRGN